MYFSAIIACLAAALLLSEAGASCGSETDPQNLKLTIPQSRELRDSAAAVLERNSYVSIAHVDTHFCVNNYPGRDINLSCSAWVVVDTVLKGDASQKRFAYPVKAGISEFFADIAQRYFLLYAEDYPPAALTIAPGCYSDYSGYYIHKGKFFNKYISDSNYIPVESLGWRLNETLPPAYNIWGNGTVCITAPCRVWEVRPAGEIGYRTVTVSALLDTAGVPVTGLFNHFNAGLLVTGHFETALLDGWTYEDTVFVVDRILGVTVFDSLYLRTADYGKVPGPRLLDLSRWTFDVLGRRYEPVYRKRRPGWLKFRIGPETD